MFTENEWKYIDDLIKRSLIEDLQEAGDITSKSIFSPEDTTKAIIRTKESGVISGLYLASPIFTILDPSVTVTVLSEDGAYVEKGTTLVKLEGPIISILSGERLILNFLQRLSGIATATYTLVQKVNHTTAKILDTRKTTPSLRLLEKKAVLHGGAVNHRFGLFDMIMAKDTHVKAAGGPANAVKKAKAFRKDSSIAIEVEVQSKDEFCEALNESPDRIMLDNMTVEDMKWCVDQRNSTVDKKAIELEASGNITVETIKQVAETGVDFISSGALTHSVKALDIHLVIL